MTAIDRDIPMPGSNRTKYPWADLAVGDSFVHDAKLHTARGHAYHAGCKIGRKFKAAEIDGAVRVWRIA